VSEILPNVTSDEIDHEQALEDAKREAEIKADKPPHHEDLLQRKFGKPQIHGHSQRMHIDT